MKIFLHYNNNNDNKNNRNNNENSQESIGFEANLF